MLDGIEIRIADIGLAARLLVVLSRTLLASPACIKAA